MEPDKQIDRRATVSRILVAESLAVGVLIVGALNVFWHLAGMSDGNMAISSALGLAAIAAAVLELAQMADRRMK